MFVGVCSYAHSRMCPIHRNMCKQMRNFVNHESSSSILLICLIHIPTVEVCSRPSAAMMKKSGTLARFNLMTPLKPTQVRRTTKSEVCFFLRCWFRCYDGKWDTLCLCVCATHWGPENAFSLQSGDIFSGAPQL